MRNVFNKHPKTKALIYCLLAYFICNIHQKKINNLVQPNDAYREVYVIVYICYIVEKSTPNNTFTE